MGASFCRFRTRARFHPDRHADRGLLRWSPGRSEPLRHDLDAIVALNLELEIACLTCHSSTTPDTAGEGRTSPANQQTISVSRFEGRTVPDRARRPTCRDRFPNRKERALYRTIWMARVTIQRAFERFRAD